MLKIQARSYPKIVIILFVVFMIFDAGALACTHYALTNITGAYEVNTIIAHNIQVAGLGIGLSVAAIGAFVVSGIPTGVFLVSYYALRKSTSKFATYVKSGLFITVGIFLFYHVIIMGADMINDIFYVATNGVGF